MKKNEFIPVDKIIKAVKEKNPKTEDDMKKAVKRACHEQRCSVPTKTFIEVLWELLFGKK